ncbi:Hypothetical_protein [Hexamita inflata]|uniref:Hypothetical_protein n=1 Tax=Hexamita inflata TaxID=28002 RepID=A0AA86QZV6_9EUKA|nr:Hypothetical protein HINF_LOCUS51367 [Hexamita inflata]
MLEARSFTKQTLLGSSEPSQRCSAKFTSAPWCIVSRLPLEVISLISSRLQVTRRSYSVCVCVSLSVSTLYNKLADAVFRLVRLLVSVVLRSFNTNPRCTNIQKSISLPKRRTEPGSLKSNSERSSVKIACNTENIQWRVQRELVQNCGAPRLMR